ncbi:hypothetical protein Tco_0182053 [Tanacetum coccineum]
MKDHEGFHLDALPAAAAPPPPPPAVDDHDDSYGLDLLFESIYCQWCGEIFPDLDSSTMHIFSAHVVAPLDDVADCGSCFSCFC